MSNLLSLARSFLGPSAQDQHPSESELLHSDLTSYPTSVPFAIGKVHISRICVYPIKVATSPISCKGTDVSETRYTPESLEYDRRWGIADAGTHRILTIRQVPKMICISPRIVTDPASPHGGTLEVSFPTESRCETFRVPLDPTQDLLNTWETIDDGSVNGSARVDGYICCASASPSSPDPSVVLSRYLERPVHLIMKGLEPRVCDPTAAFPALEASTLYHDAFPVHAASEESIAEFERVLHTIAADQSTNIGGLDRERWLKGAVAIDRFRPNLILKGAGVPFAEDFWREVTISSAEDDGRKPTEVTFVQKCARCLLPNVDPSGGVKDLAVPFKVLMKFRTSMYHEAKNKAVFGTYGIFGGSGVMKVNDVVTVTQWTDAYGV